MYAAKLRKVGGSVMLALPAALLKILRLQIDEKLDLSIEGNRLILTPQKHVRYTMTELLAQSDYSQKRTKDEQEWLDTPPQGKEIL